MQSTTVANTCAVKKLLQIHVQSTTVANTLIGRNPPPTGGFPIYYVPSSRTVCKRTPLEGFVPGSSRGVLLHTVLDEGT